MNSTIWTSALAFAWSLGLGMAAPASAQNGLLSHTGGAPSWPQWQGRVALSADSSTWRGWRNGLDSNQVSRVRLLGDYYFSSSNLLGSSAASTVVGGFRATSGLMLGGTSTQLLSGFGPTLSTTGLSVSRSSLGQGLPSTGADDAALPYIGLGYTSLSSRGGWGFSADIGVVSLNPRSTVRLGRSGSNQPLEDVLREMRFSPLLHLGVSYAF